MEGLRPRAGDERPIRWGGKVLAYRSFYGVRIPSQVEVYWQPESGYAPYYRGTITEVDYNLPQVY